MFAASGGGADFTSNWAGAGAAILLLSVAIGFNLKNQVSQARENRLCNWRLGQLVKTLVEHDIAVPPDFWTGPESDRKKKRRLSMKLAQEEDGITKGFFLSIVSTAIIGIVALALVLNAFVLAPLHEATTAADRSDCRSKALGLTLYWTLSALNDPPVPADATTKEKSESLRGQHVAKGKQAAQPVIQNLC